MNINQSLLIDKESKRQQQATDENTKNILVSNHHDKTNKKINREITMKPSAFTAWKEIEELYKVLQFNHIQAIYVKFKHNVHRQFEKSLGSFYTYYK